jgi:hypothetical protein
LPSHLQVFDAQLTFTKSVPASARQPRPVPSTNALGITPASSALTPLPSSKLTEAKQASACLIFTIVMPRTCTSFPLPASLKTHQMFCRLTTGVFGFVRTTPAANARHAGEKRQRQKDTKRLDTPPRFVSSKSARFHTREETARADLFAKLKSPDWTPRLGKVHTAAQGMSHQPDNIFAGTQATPACSLRTAALPSTSA